MNKIVIAGTGHRPDKLWGYNLNHPMYVRLRTGIVKWLQNLFAVYDEVEVISGMALGFDTVLAQATLLLREQGYNIKLHCAIPCFNHCAKWREESVNEWNRITNLADTVVVVNQDSYKSWHMQKRNEYMVDKCDIVLALWDGSTGGTYNCIKYAESKGKKICRLRQQ